MAAVDQLNRHTLPSGLFDQADCYEFTQLVRVLERAAVGKVGVGSGSDPAHEAINFRSKVGFEFSTSDVLGATALGHGMVRVDVAFMGIAGNEGTLPQPYAELVLQRSRPAAVRANFPSAPGQADDDARDFLDIFNHRLLSYFYRGRKKHSIALGADSGAAAPLLERLLFQLIGYNEGVSYNDGTHGHAQVDPRCLLRYAGLLASRERSMAGLEQMLADAFNAPVRGTQQQGCWLALDPRFRTTIGPRGKNQALGHSTVLGKRAWDARGKMTLDIGPLHMARYEALLPGGALHAQLLFMVRFYLREDLDVDVVLHLAAPDEQAAPALGQSRLARNAWLGKGDAARQARSTRFALGRWHP